MKVSLNSKYIGNVDGWNMSDHGTCKYQWNANLMKCETIYTHTHLWNVILLQTQVSGACQSLECANL